MRKERSCIENRNKELNELYLDIGAAVGGASIRGEEGEPEGEGEIDTRSRVNTVHEAG